MEIGKFQNLKIIQKFKKKCKFVKKIHVILTINKKNKIILILMKFKIRYNYYNIISSKISKKFNN